jgi:hypothetical protein
MGCSLPLTQAGALLLAVTGLALGAAPGAVAAESEVRQFNNYIDSRYAGEYRMTIASQDDGSVSVTGQAKVDVRVFLVHYTYSYRGSEVWKDGRLLRFESSANDNGKKFTVAAAAEANGLRVTVNGGRERVLPPNVWTTTYWRLPDVNARGTPLPLLDADTGRDLTGTLQYVGESQVPIGGQMQNCTHYRVTSDVTVDLWYDGQERLVRQAWVEDNRQIVLQLAQVSH